MLVLHGSWMLPQRGREACFAVWGELVEGMPPWSRRGRRPLEHPPRPRRHLFAAPVDRLRDALVAVGVPDAAEAESTTLLVRLPSAGGLPLPSPELAPDACPLDELPVLAPWRVEALQLDIAPVIRQFPGLAQEAMPADVLLGDDISYWVAVSRVALELLYRQRVVPTLQRERRRYLARWRPVLDDWDDIERFGALVKAMPAACRALAWRNVEAAPEPQTLLNSFLSAAVEAVARQAMASAGLPERRRSYSSNGYYGADAWLQALAGDPAVETWRFYLDDISAHFRASDEPAGAPGTPAPRLRVCFRLEPPSSRAQDGGDGVPRWTLRYLLQATDDPSLLVPAGDVWRRAGESARLLGRRFEYPQEALLAGLGHAARVYPPIAVSLQEAAPAATALTPTQAYEFLRERALQLRAAGFGVLVPGLETKLSLRLRLGRKSDGNQGGVPSMLGVDTLVDFNWQLALGGESISREEFEELVKAKEPLVEVRGRWVELRPELVERALAFFQKQSAAGEMRMAEALRMALAPDAGEELEVEEVETAGWFDDLLQRLSDGAGREQVEQPEGFVGQLRPYQETGVSWLATLRRYGLGACLADDMGLGKTPMTIALLLHARDQGAKDGPTLVICPTSVVGNWRHELARFAPSLRVLVHHGAGRNKEAFAAEAARHDVVITTYALVHRDQEALASVAWSDVVLDEAQNIKNPSTKAAQVARKLPARWRAALTGTPVENRLTDLWSIFQFLNPGYLGSAEDFRRRFASRIERGRDQEAVARLRTLVSPFILRRLKTDRAIIADLPEKNEMKTFCILTREQATLYQAVVRDSLRRIEAAEGFARRGEILAALTRLKQVCDHPALFLKDGSRLSGRSGKLSRLTEMLEEAIAEGDRALVFTQFAEMGKLLQEHLQAALGEEVLFLYGATPAPERDEMVQRFNGGDGPHVFVLSIRAGGTGLNLTGANRVFHYDRWWNPAVENQATDRAFRIGQRRDVQVHKFICGGTLEETIDQLIERKTELSEAIVGTGETWITEMSTEELRELFTLRRDDVWED